MKTMLLFIALAAITFIGCGGDTEPAGKGGGYFWSKTVPTAYASGSASARPPSAPTSPTSSASSPHH